MLYKWRKAHFLLTRHNWIYELPLRVKFANQKKKKKKRKKIENAEFGIRNSEFEIRNSEFGIRNSEFGIRNSEFEIGNSWADFNETCHV